VDTEPFRAKREMVSLYTAIRQFRGTKPRETGGGRAGIRTLGNLAATTVFETAPIVHSGTLP
jgi:hypothetical protein